MDFNLILATVCPITYPLIVTVTSDCFDRTSHQYSTTFVKIGFHQFSYLVRKKVLGAN